MESDGGGLAERRQIVAQALASVRANGVDPHPEVLALYERYAAGEIGREEVQATMLARATAIQAKKEREKKRLDLGAV